LLDKQSIQVSYDYVRGEPRDKLSKNRATEKGDCIDCGQCVDVCPTGIDIRNGTQLECINCTACIDACNHVMEKVGYKENLIKYASEKGIEENKPIKPNARMIGLSAIMVVLIGILITILTSRSDIETSILRTPGMTYQIKKNNEVSNLYNVKLLNKSHKDKAITFKLEHSSGNIKMVGNDTIHLLKESIGSSIFFINIYQKNITKRKTKLKIGVYENGEKVETVSTTFLAPIKRTK
jgi:cytochrome c oxidase accessory protein FixG